MQFAWDPRKAAANLRKHGVSFDEAATVFEDPLTLAVDDLDYPERTLVVGMSRAERLLVVVHVEMSEHTLRLISARRPAPHERRRYEEGT